MTKITIANGISNLVHRCLNSLTLIDKMINESITEQTSFFVLMLLTLVNWDLQFSFECSAPAFVVEELFQAVK